MDINCIGSWIFYNAPVRKKELARYLQAGDPKLRTILTFLTYHLPLYEEDDGSLGINLALGGFKSFCLMAPTAP